MTSEELRKLADEATEFIPGYVVTRDGRVFSTGTNWRGYGIRELAQQPNTHGYMRVRCLQQDGSRKSFYVHKLVANAYLPPCTPGHEVRHLNGVRTDNRKANLAWGTRSDNALDRYRHAREKVAQ